MRILGIDPGFAIVGWGVIDYRGSRLIPVAYGAITTPAKTPMQSRLSSIYSQLGGVIDKYGPSRMSIEELFWNTNSTTGIAVAEARGVILLGAHTKGLAINEYTPLQVKQAVVGYGRAEKKQVMTMVKTLLGLDAIPRPDDAADALAMAICDAHCGGSSLQGLV